jgi:hypothetical protein
MHMSTVRGTSTGSAVAQAVVCRTRSEIGRRLVVDDPARDAHSMSCGCGCLSRTFERGGGVLPLLRPAAAASRASERASCVRSARTAHGVHDREVPQRRQTISVRCFTPSHHLPHEIVRRSCEHWSCSRSVTCSFQQRSAQSDKQARHTLQRAQMTTNGALLAVEQAGTYASWWRSQARAGRVSCTRTRRVYACTGAVPCACDRSRVVRSCACAAPKHVCICMRMQLRTSTCVRGADDVGRTAISD